MKTKIHQGAWLMAMDWHDLLFAHWPIDAAEIQSHLPAGLTVDTYEGQAWLGIVPFRMSGVRLRWFPGIPGIRAFPELNVRTYVKCAGVPGVWFFSLDAASRFAVRVARATFHLPYMDAKMTCGTSDSWVHYRSERIHRNAGGAAFIARYRPVEPLFAAVQGTLDHWLVERYSLYAADGAGRIYRGDILHEPWGLQRAEAVFDRMDMTGWMGMVLPGIEPRLLFARYLSVRAWPLVRVSP